MNLCSNSNIDFIKLIPLFLFNECSSFREQFNYLSIVKSESYFSNLLPVVSSILIIVFLVLNSVDSVFHLILNEYFELGIFTYWIVGIIIVFLPSIIGFWIDVKLGGVISSCDGFNIPIDVIIDLNAFDVIDVQHCEQVNKDSH